MAESQYVNCAYDAWVWPWPYGSIASRLAVAVSRSSANWGRYYSTDVVNEFTITSVGREASYALPSL